MCRTVGRRILSLTPSRDTTGSTFHYLREKEGSGDCKTMSHGASSARLSAQGWFFMEVSILTHSCAIWPNSPFLAKVPPQHITSFPTKGMAHTENLGWFRSRCPCSSLVGLPGFGSVGVGWGGWVSKKQAECYWFATNCS